MAHISQDLSFLDHRSSRKNPWVVSRLIVIAAPQFNKEEKALRSRPPVAALTPDKKEAICKLRKNG